MSRTYNVKVGVPYIPEPIHEEECCGCGLKHKLKIRPIDAKGKTIKGADVEITVLRIKKPKK